MLAGVPGSVNFQKSNKEQDSAATTNSDNTQDRFNVGKYYMLDKRVVRWAFFLT